MNSVFHKPRISKGYRYVYAPESLSAKQNGSYVGYVLEHRLVVENNIGRQLLSDEHVHHKDLNTLNNSIDNLVVLTNEDHIKLHHLLKSNKEWRNRLVQDGLFGHVIASTYRKCVDCGTEISVMEDSESSVCRCKLCAAVHMRKVKRPSKERLIELLTGGTLSKVGDYFGVSGKTVRKWADAYEIDYKRITCYPRPSDRVIAIFTSSEVRDKNRNAVRAYHEKCLSVCCRSVLCLSKHGEIIKKYNKISDAKRDGFNDSPISRCCKGKSKTYKGYRWQYCDDCMT